MAKTPPQPLDDDVEVRASGKGRPTPSRRERELANRKPLIGDKSKEAKRAARQALASEREKARIGMLNGDEKYLTPRDRGPQRRYARDYVDARFSVGELLIPVMIVILFLSTLPNAEVRFLSYVALWTFFLIAIVDAFFVGWALKRRLTAKFGRVEKGVRLYGAMRAMQFRRMRVPKPQVKRNQFPD
ncbi:DUF3043 domain-containing protein [Desertivibrio insolitus]|uniref:DUF3043 domain-containing protein n=1 Tax=Herbiconiux sp. SYSU D00978 TaxID=2812562 RepID=UPI001A977518|nr:DUF3043 domain-containing protein [Herbiconiux sp. SYSU D00978]